MIDNLASRLDGQVLVVAAVHPGSELAAALRAPDRYGLAGRVVTAEADPDMSAASRTGLARELRPGLPDSAIERIGQRTASFAEVFTVAGEERLTDVITADGPSAVHIVDTVIDAVLARRTPSAQARVLAWAGGVLTERQADQALAILGEPNDPDDPEVIRAGGLARLRDPASSHVTGQADLLATSARRALAAAVLAEAAGIARDPDATLIERTVARLAAHRIRADLDPSAELTKVQCLLIRGLEQLGDPEAAYQVAATALAELPRDPQTAPQRADLLKAWLRLARTRPEPADDPLIQEAINLATTSGALFGTEARVWAAVNLLRRPGPRDAALSLVDQITTDLGTYPGRDPAVNQWRLLLAFHAGQAGYPATAQQLLAPIISGGTTEQQDAAQAVLRALEGPRSDIRLQIIILETELHATPATADEDRLRLHHALAGTTTTSAATRTRFSTPPKNSAYDAACNAPTTPTSWPPAATSPSGPASVVMPRPRCSCPGSCCPTRSGCWAPTTPTSWPPAATSPSGPASAAMPRPRCSCSGSCCPTRSGCWAPTTPTSWPPAATSPPGPASVVMPRPRCGCSGSCCPTRSGCWAPTTPTS